MKICYLGRRSGCSTPSPQGSEDVLELFWDNWDDFGHMQRLGKTTIGDFVREQVLRLSYTADDLAPFARDLGYDGSPFAWDAEDRRHRIARLDALYFNLYGLSRDEAAYVLDTFPIVREQDEARFNRYRTKELVLGYMNALAAGDTETVLAL